MPSSGSRVVLDTSDFVRGVRQLAAGLERAGGREGTQQAQKTADAIAGQTPVLTGALVSTVGVVPEAHGAGVTYGGDLPYAWKINRESHAVDDALDGVEDDFRDQMLEAGRVEVRRL